jgi:cytochrome P450
VAIDEDAARLLKAPGTQTDPYPAYDELRARCPVRVGSRSAILLRYDHVRAALADPDRFSSNVRDSDNPAFRHSPLVFDDPPQHTHVRRVLAKAFTPRRIAEAEPWVRALAHECVDAMAATIERTGAPADFVEHVADPLPVRAIATMLGISTERHRDFKRWSNDRSHVTYNFRGPRTEALESAIAGVQAQHDFFLEVVRERRAAPGDDLVSALVQAEVDGDRLDDDEAAGVCSVLLSAGNLTTTRLLGSLVARLAADDDAWQHVRAGGSGARDAVIEDVLRLESPVQTPIRMTTCDVELAGTVLPKGTFVTIGIGAANRDPAGADQPHLAFGHGIHYCMGAALARLEASIVLEVLVERGPRLRLDGEARPEVGMSHRGYLGLPVRLV